MTSKKLNIYLRRDGRWEGRLATGTHHGKTSYRYVYAKSKEEALNADLSPGNRGILLCLYTGLRIGEICALRWREVSKSDQSIAVICTMQRIFPFLQQ